MTSSSLENYFDDCFPNLKESLRFFSKELRYSFFSGGKRFRPLLLTACGEALGLKEKDMYPAAMAVELIHTYSLIHDDLPAMDDDTYRRERLSHHAKYGEASAVLTGDALLTQAFSVLAQTYKGPALEKLVLLLSSCAGVQGMVGGQVLDCLTDHRTEEVFYRIHLLKTGKLFAFCLAAPAILAEKDEAPYVRFGENLGVLFQLQDDLFDKEKKSQRAEENILSLISEEELTQKISKLKSQLQQEAPTLGFLPETKIAQLLDKLFSRQY